MDIKSHPQRSHGLETTDKQLALKQLRNARRCEVLDVRRQREGALSLDWADQEFFSRERNI